MIKCILWKIQIPYYFYKLFYSVIKIGNCTKKKIMFFMFQQQNMCQIMASQQNSFLYTVSRLVSSRDIRRRSSEEEGGRLLHVTDPDPTIKPKHIPKPPILETLFYIHLIAFFAILSMSWIDTLPGIGRVS